MRILPLLVAALLALAAPGASLARDTVIGLSSAQTQDALKTQTERVMMHLLSSMQPGETARFYDATKAELIGIFTVPDGSNATAPKRILNHNRGTVAQIGAFIRTGDAVPGHLGRIDLPGFLRLVRETAPAPEGGADLILLGHPLHHEAHVPSQSMSGGRVPSDGHIAATPGQSLYATDGLPGSLAGYDVYFGLLGAGWSISPEFAHHVTRFWTLSVEAHGGSMAYLGQDLASLFDLAGQDVPDRTHPEPLRADEKREMLSFAADDGSVPDLFGARPQEAAAPPPVWSNANSVTVGITWEVAQADLDLYLRPDPTAPVIYFGQADTPDGRLFKDFTSSPGTGFETVALKKPFDLSGMRLAVNYYGGTRAAGGVSGEIRIAIGNQVWAQPFHVTATRGNQGTGQMRAVRDNEAPNAAWVILDPMEVIGAAAGAQP